MKSALRMTMLLFTVFGVCQSSRAQQPDVAQLLHDVPVAYSSLYRYSATGEVISGIITDGSSTLLPSGPQETRTTFTIKLARPQMYKVVWEQGNNFFTSKGAVWSDGQSRFVNVAGQTTQPAD